MKCPKKMDQNLKDKKKLFCKSQINLPFPYPMLDKDDQTVRWPFKEEGFLLAIGRLNPIEKLIEINDLSTIVALNKMGFFGIHSNREIIMDRQFSLKDEQKTQSRHRFTIGYYFTKPIELSPALQPFPDDLNKLKTKKESKEDSDQNCKPPPFECLKLSLEEAYFLSYVFGMLKIRKQSSDNDNESFYNLKEQWKIFCEIMDSQDPKIKFPTRFAAYYYFRSKGFVVKNGFKFGVDYLLYEDGPPFNHSRYSVLIQNQHKQKEPLNFKEISTLTRISKNSCKDLLMCLVIIPEQMIINNMINDGPECIKHFLVDIIEIDRIQVAGCVSIIENEKK